MVNIKVLLGSINMLKDKNSTLSIGFSANYHTIKLGKSAGNSGDGSDGMSESSIKSTSIEPDKRSAEDHKIISEYDKKFSKKILGNAGDIVILNISVFHGGTKNISGKRRRIIFANYRDSNLRTQIDHYKYIPKTKHDNFNNFQKSILSLYKKDLITNFRRWLWERRSWGVVKLIYKIGKKIRN